MGKIGLQLYSIRESLAKDFIGGLHKVSKIGYDGVEFAGFYDVPAETLKKTLDETGLEPCGSHTPVKLLKDSLDDVIEYNLAIGNKYIICPAVPVDMRDSEDAWLRTAELFNKIGRKCKENGLLFGYHNHAHEFTQFNGKYGFDILCENTDPGLMFIEIDTFWVEYTGLRSIDFMKKYSDRLLLLHIKDMKSWDDRVSTEVGSGVVNIKEICEYGKKFGTQWYIVEQENFDKPQEQSIKESLEYLRTIL